MTESLRIKLTQTMFELKFKKACEAIYEVGVVLLYRAYNEYIAQTPGFEEALKILPNSFKHMVFTPPINGVSNVIVPLMRKIALPFKVPINIAPGHIPVNPESEIAFDIQTYKEDVADLINKHHLIKTRISTLLAQHSTTKLALGAVTGQMKSLLQGAIRLHIKSQTDQALEFEDSLRSARRPSPLSIRPTYNAATIPPAAWISIDTTA